MEPRRLAALLASAAALAAPLFAQGQPLRIEVQPLANASSLTAQDVAVLDALVLSSLSELPKERFEVVADTTVFLPECDTACRVRAAQLRGTGQVVVGRVAAFGQGFVGAVELYDVATAQLLKSATTDVAADAPAFLSAMKGAAAQIRDALAPAPAPREAPAPAPTAATAPPAAKAPAGAEAVTATLRVETTPPGAEIHIKRLGQSNFAGRSPLEKVLLPVEYLVIAKLPEHETAEKEVRLDPLTTTTVRLTLGRDYPLAASKKWGHAAFWSGVAVAGFGFLAMGLSNSAAESYEHTLGDDYREASMTWAGVMWVSFGLSAALTVTGVVLWAGTPSSRTQWEKTHGKLAIAPCREGGVAALYGRSF